MIGFASLSDGAGQAVASIPSPSWNSFDIGPLTLNIYGLAIATGVLVGLWLARSRYAASGGDPELMDRVAIWAIVAGIIGARIGFVIPRLDEFSDDPLKAFEIWEGGLTFFGALVGGFLVGAFLLRRNDVSIPLFLTAAAPAIPLAQAIGRLGNYFNQELYGKPTDLPWGLEIDPDQRVEGYRLVDGYGPDTTFHPTFLYEMLWNLALVALLLVIGRKVRLRAGSLFGVYLIGYGIGRFLMELIRIDTEWRLFGLSRNAYNSIGIVILGSVGLWLWERVLPRRADAEDEPAEAEADEAADTEPADDDESADAAADEAADTEPADDDESADAEADAAGADVDEGDEGDEGEGESEEEPVAEEPATADGEDDAKADADSKTPATDTD